MPYEHIVELPGELEGADPCNPAAPLAEDVPHLAPVAVETASPHPHLGVLIQVVEQPLDCMVFCGLLYKKTLIS